MRLIDADKLIEYIDVGHFRSPNKLCFSEMDVVNMLLHAPTAYDIDSVLNQLEKLKKIEYDKEDECDENGYGDSEQIFDDGVSQGRYSAFVKSIEIVKGGRLHE